MPIYEYRCQECQTVFEAIVSLSLAAREEPRRCPHCKSTNVVKLLSAAAIHTGGPGGGVSFVSGSGGCGPAGSGFS